MEGGCEGVTEREGLAGRKVERVYAGGEAGGKESDARMFCGLYGRDGRGV